MNLGPDDRAGLLLPVFPERGDNPVSKKLKTSEVVSPPRTRG